MTGQEILVYLLNKGVIHCIEGSYVPTSKVQELVANVSDVATINVAQPGTVDLSELYPEEIRSVGDNYRVAAVLNYCEVPTTITSSRGNYLVRSTDLATRNTLHKKMLSSDYIPEVLLKTIKEYYALIEFPKSFKKFLAEDFDSLYKSYSEGDFLDKGDDMYQREAS